MPVKQELLDKIGEYEKAGYSVDDIVAGLSESQNFPDVAQKVKSYQTEGYGAADIIGGIRSSPVDSGGRWYSKYFNPSANQTPPELTASAPDQAVMQEEQSQRFGKGNIDLTTRPVVNNPDGTISTVRSMGINVDGKETLIPTISDDGRSLSPEQAIAQFKTTGKHLGQFDTVDEANAYAEQLHKDQARQYSQLTTEPTGRSTFTAPEPSELLDMMPEQPTQQGGPNTLLTRGLAAGTTGLFKQVGIALDMLGTTGGESPQEQRRAKRLSAEGLSTDEIAARKPIGNEILKKVGKVTSDYWDIMADQYGPPQDIQGSIVKNPGLLKSPKWWTYNIGQMMPSTVATIGAFMAGGPVVAGIIGGGLEGLSTYETMIESGETSENAKKAMVLMGIGSAALNAIPFATAVNRIPGLKAKTIQYLASAGLEGVTEWLEEPWEAISKGIAIGHIDPEEVKRQTIEGLNVLPIAALQGLLIPGAGGISQRQVSAPADSTTATFNNAITELKRMAGEESPIPAVQPQATGEPLGAMAPIQPMTQPGAVEALKTPPLEGQTGEAARRAEMTRAPLAETDMINAISKGEATDRIAAGDASVIPHIEAGVKSLGTAAMQDEMINGALAKAKAAGTLADMAKIEPDLRAALRGENVPRAEKGEKSNAIKELQMREVAQKWSEILPGLPRDTYERLSQFSPDDLGATEKEQLQKLRARISESGEATEEAMRNMWGSNLANAPRGLQQALAGDMVMPKVPLATAQSEITERRAANDVLRKHIDDLAIRTAKGDEAARQEFHNTLMVDKVSGAHTQRAYDIIEKAEGPANYIMSTDVKGLHAINNKLSQKAGDNYLRMLTQAYHEEGIPVFRYGEKSDEFLSRFKTFQEANEAKERVDNRFRKSIIEVPQEDGTSRYFTNLEFYTGIGGHYGEKTAQDNAFNKLYEAKRIAKSEPGYNREALPANLVELSSEELAARQKTGWSEVLPGPEKSAEVTPTSEKDLLEFAGSFMQGRTRHDNYEAFVSSRPAGWTFDEGGQFLAKVASGESKPKNEAQKLFVAATIEGARDLKAREEAYNALPTAEVNQPHWSDKLFKKKTEVLSSPTTKAAAALETDRLSAVAPSNPYEMTLEDFAKGVGANDKIKPIAPTGKTPSNPEGGEIIIQRESKQFTGLYGNIYQGRIASSSLNLLTDAEFKDITGFSKKEFEGKGGSIYFIPATEKESNSIHPISGEIVLSDALESNKDELKKTIIHELTHWGQIQKGDVPRNFYVDPSESIRKYMEYMSDPAEVKAKFNAEGKSHQEYEDFMEQLHFAKSEEAGKLQPFEIGEMRTETQKKNIMPLSYIAKELEYVKRDGTRYDDVYLPGVGTPQLKKNINELENILKQGRTDSTLPAINTATEGKLMQLGNRQPISDSDISNLNLVYDAIRRKWSDRRLEFADRKLAVNEIEVRETPVLRIEVRGQVNTKTGQRNSINPIIIEGHLRNSSGIRGSAVGPNEIDIDLTPDNLGKINKLQSAIGKRISNKSSDIPRLTKEGGQELYSFPAGLIKALRPLARDAKAAYPHLVELGQKVYEQGHMKYFDFKTQMKKLLGDMWDGFKHLMEKLYFASKKTVASISFSINQKSPDIVMTTTSNHIGDFKNSTPFFVKRDGKLWIKLGPLFSAETIRIQNLHSNSDTLGDFINWHIGINKSFGKLPIPMKLAMISRVRLLLHDPKIGKAIISNIPVDVMNDLAGKKFSPKVLFHNPSMLSDSFTIDKNGNIPTRVLKAMDFIVGDPTFPTTEVIFGTGNMRGWPNNLAATKTTDSFHGISPSEMVNTLTILTHNGKRVKDKIQKPTDLFKILKNERGAIGEGKIPDDIRATWMKAVEEALAAGKDVPANVKRQFDEMRGEFKKGTPAESDTGGGTTGFTPEKGFRREPTSEKSGEPIRRSDIVKLLHEKLDVPIRVGRFRGTGRGVFGIFKIKPEVIRTKFANDIETIAHEIGHGLHKFLWSTTPKGNLSAKPLSAFRDELEPIASKPRAGQSKLPEGFAEFIRLYMTNEVEAKAKAPKFYPYFESLLDSHAPEAKEIFLDARKKFDDWLKQSPLDRIKGQISNEPEKRKGLTFSDMYTAIVDELHPLAKAVKDMAGGKEIAVSEDPAKLAQLFKGWWGKADSFLEYKTFDPDTYEFKGKSLRAILTPIKDKVADFEAYLVARRAIELHDRVIDDKPSPIETGVLYADAQKVVSQFPQFAVPAQELYWYQNEVLTYLKKSGLLSDEAYAKMKSLNKDYVPFFRVMDQEGMGGTGKGLQANQPVKKIKGSWRDIVSPLESVIKNTYAYINLAEKNAIGRALVDLAESKGGLGKYVEAIPTPLQRVTVTGEEIGKLDPEIAEAIAAAGLSEDTVNIFRTSPFTPRDNVIAVWKNGNKKLYQVDPEIYRTWAALDKEQLNLLTRIMAYPARWLRAGATLTPEFIARNPARDQFTAFVYSKYGYVPGYDLAKGVFHAIKKDDLYWKWKISGGEHSMLVSMDREYVHKSLEKVLRGRGLFVPENWKDALKNPLNALRMFSEFGEAGTRIGEFGAALKKSGVSKEGILKGGAASREVTLDFGINGAKTKAVKAIIAFWNAQVQGTVKMARAFKERPTATAAKVFAAITLPSILLAASQGDDGRWDEIPLWQKNLFWVILPGHVSREAWKAMSAKEKAEFSKEHGIWRIPKPFELGIVFGSIPERLVEYAIRKDPKVFNGIAGTVAGGFAPSAVPTAALPIIENFANRSVFTDRPLVSQSQEGILPQYQGREYTTETAKKIGGAIASIPGMRESKAASPPMIENVVRGWGGGLGMYGLYAIDAALKASGLSPDKERVEKVTSDTPLLKAFAVRFPASDAESIQRFYDNAEHAERMKKTNKWLMKNRGTELEQDDLIPTLANTKKVIGKIQNIIHVINSEKGKDPEIYNSIASYFELPERGTGEITPADRKKMTDTLYFKMIEIADQGNEIIKNYKPEDSR